MKRTVSVSSLGSSASGAESPKSVLDYHRCENSPDFQQQQQQKQRFAPKPPKPSPRPAQGDLRPSSKIVGLELVAALDRQQRGDLSSAVRLTRSSIARVQQLRRSLETVAEAPSFLRSCCLCKKGIACGRDIYMYRGIQAFCSLDCRDEQIIQDEKEERIARNKHKCLYRKGPNWRAKATMTAAA